MATSYKTVSQLLPKKSGVKLFEHLNHITERAGTLKNGRNPKSRNRVGKLTPSIKG